MKKLYPEIYYLLTAPVGLFFCFLLFTGKRRNGLAGIHSFVINSTGDMNIRFMRAINEHYEHIVTPPPPPPYASDNQHYISKFGAGAWTAGVGSFNLFVIHHRISTWIFRVLPRAPTQEALENISFSLAHSRE
ncbi:MAG: hypothetical protein LBG28_03455 [Tannerella sp.]|jgi:hypothetical protein|nr:hypothetical protein [Tannerella sp.]